MIRMTKRSLLTFELTTEPCEFGETLGVYITSGENLKPEEYAIALAYIRAIQPVTNKVLAMLDQ